MLMPSYLSRHPCHATSQRKQGSEARQICILFRRIRKKDQALRIDEMRRSAPLTAYPRVAR